MRFGHGYIEFQSSAISHLPLTTLFHDTTGSERRTVVRQRERSCVAKYLRHRLWRSNQTGQFRGEEVGLWRLYALWRQTQVRIISWSFVRPGCERRDVVK